MDMAQAASTQQRLPPLASHMKLINKETLFIPLAAAILSIIVFANTLGNDFVWDDTELISENPAVHSLSNITQFFTGHFWSQSEQPSARGYYRPIVLSSYAIDYFLWRNNAFGFHLTNLLLHALASALVCLLLLGLRLPSMAALSAGLLFAVLPVHVESVAFISGRTDVLATVFVLLSLCLFLSARRKENFIFGLSLSVLFFGLALLSKEVAAVLPVLLLMLEVVRPQPGSLRRRLALHVPFWLVLAGYLGLRFVILNIKPDVQGRLSFVETALTMPGVTLDYVRLLVLPVDLCADYAVKVQRILTVGNGAAIGALALTAFGLAFLFLRRKPAAFFIGWILLGLLPVLQVIPISILKAERFLYLPSVGYCALIGWAGTLVVERVNGRKRMVVIAGLLLILCAYSLQTVKRNTVWRDELSLYQATVAAAPDNFRAQYNLGNAYFRSGDVERALLHTQTAYALKPDFPQIAYNLGVMYESYGRHDDAESMYRRAIELNPSYAQAHNNLAAVLFMKGRIEEAEAHWKKALALDEHLEQARQGLLLLDGQNRVPAGELPR